MNKRRTGEFKNILMCVGVTARKQFLSYKTFVVFAIVLIFHWYAFGGVPKICEYLGFAIAPWVLPFFNMNPTMYFVVGGMAMLMHCDAPFMDGQTPLLVARMGRRAWIVAQLIYLFLSSAVYVLFHAVSSIIVMMPYVGYSSGWGAVMKGLARNTSIPGMAGVTIGFYPYPEFMERFTPFQAMGWTMLVLWLGTVFIGLIIFLMRIITGKMTGVAIGGFMTALAYFAAYQGVLVIGKVLYFISPISWTNINLINWGGAPLYPTPAYVLVCYALLIAVISVLSVKMFCTKDLAWEEI